MDDLFDGDPNAGAEVATNGAAPRREMVECPCMGVGKVFDVKDDIVDIFVDKFGVVPIDPIGPVGVDPKIKVGPITGTMAKMKVAKVSIITAGTPAIR